MADRVTQLLFTVTLHDDGTTNTRMSARGACAPTVGDLNAVIDVAATTIVAEGKCTHCVERAKEIVDINLRPRLRTNADGDVLQ